MPSDVEDRLFGNSTSQSSEDDSSNESQNQSGSDNKANSNKEKSLVDLYNQINEIKKKITDNTNPAAADALKETLKTVIEKINKQVNKMLNDNPHLIFDKYCATQSQEYQKLASLVALSRKLSDCVKDAEVASGLLVTFDVADRLLDCCLKASACSQNGGSYGAAFWSTAIANGVDFTISLLVTTGGGLGGGAIAGAASAGDPVIIAGGTAAGSITLGTIYSFAFSDNVVNGLSNYYYKSFTQSK
jgi:sugar (pentulose or hexulose) kinase